MASKKEIEVQRPMQLIYDELLNLKGMIDQLDNTIESLKDEIEVMSDELRKKGII